MDSPLPMSTYPRTATQALLDTSKSLATSPDERHLLDDFCQNALEQGRFALAWYGRLRKDGSYSVEPVAAAGVAAEYARGLTVTFDDSETGGGPVGHAARTGVVTTVHETRESPREHSLPDFAPWRARAAAFGLRSCTSIPIHVKGVVEGVLSVYSQEPGVFGETADSIHIAMARQVGIGIEHLRTASQLVSSLTQTVQVLTATIDARDIYTSGHQTKVAAIGSEIARRLGMTEFEVQGVSVAGTLHDIGKMAVPLEVLLKPAALSPDERQLVQTHAARGEEILARAQFPWPIASTVGAHHERLDGSGYPRGLTADGIDIATRIVSVSDVFDALTAARPYRAGYTYEVAMKFLHDRAGVKFDAEVVAALHSIPDEELRTLRRLPSESTASVGLPHLP